MAKKKSEPSRQLSLNLTSEEDSTQNLSIEEREQELRALAKRISECKECYALVGNRTQTVFGHGPLDSDLCFVGEAPGADEDAQGFPFIGAVGQMLNRIISAMAMKREEVYVCNIVKCRPPNNRTPTTEEANNCRAFLDRQLALVKPKHIIALGSCAAQNLLGSKQSIGKLRGRVHDYERIPVFCTYHPAFLLPSRSPEKKRDVWEDMKFVLTEMGLPIPGEE